MRLLSVAGGEGETTGTWGDNGALGRPLSSKSASRYVISARRDREEEGEGIEVKGDL